MELVCDAEGRPAPRLIDVAIERDAAISIYADLVAQTISMLCCDLIHGDLSPYNILAAADGPTIIDFPQVISAVAQLARGVLLPARLRQRRALPGELRSEPRRPRRRRSRDLARLRLARADAGVRAAAASAAARHPRTRLTLAPRGAPSRTQRPAAAAPRGSAGAAAGQRAVFVAAAAEATAAAAAGPWSPPAPEAPLVAALFAGHWLDRAECVERLGEPARAE